MTSEPIVTGAQIVSRVQCGEPVPVATAAAYAEAEQIARRTAVESIGSKRRDQWNATADRIAAASVADDAEPGDAASRTLADRTIADAAELSCYALARLAETSDPYSPVSPGARWLASVRDDTIDRMSELPTDDRDGCCDNLSDLACSIADASLPVYTRDTWSVFVDLGAWDTDTDDYGSESRNLTDRANYALFAIAQTLAYAIADMICNPEGE